MLYNITNKIKRSRYIIFNKNLVLTILNKLAYNLRINRF